MRKGLIFILSAPAGTGKNTLVNRLITSDPLLVEALSATTRLPRQGERSGHHYTFLTQTAFQKSIANGEFLEHSEHFGARYGTPRAEVEHHLAAGKDVILVIDTKGAKKLREQSSFKGVTIFLAPPSWETLRERLRMRGTEEEEEMAPRLTKAKEELEEAQEYDYFVVNQELGETEKVLQAIIEAERHRIRAPLPAIPENSIENKEDK